MVVHNDDSALSFVSSQGLLEPDHLSVANLSFIPFRSSCADDNHHSIVDLHYSPESESLFEEQVSCGTIVMVSACRDQVPAAEAVEPLLCFTILAQKAAVCEIPCNHNYVRIE